ncbi:MAG: cytochrome-c peroxidase [Bacteroidales bacterium]|jgi:cytochrome c peroxidase|nr:cytochrome-c peroxidase [Bacteroidales bacterium]MDY0368244.1 cytochrome-c peroxidase [Bacteroidales bacterium]
MNKFSFLTLFIVFLLMGCGSRVRQDQAEYSEADQQLLAAAQRYFNQLPEPKDPNTPLALLGKKLYYEEALSANGQMSCNTCHPIANYGVDNLPTSPGHDGSLGSRNSPTTFNAYFHTTQFWDGRSPDLADQAKGPVLNPIEMGLQGPSDVENILKNSEEYVELFTQAFPEETEPISFDNFATAIAEFESTLATPSAFDAFLDGAINELTDPQKEGLSLFMETGCIACHIGPGLGGTMMQRFGLVHGPYWEYTGSELQDLGRKDVTGNPTDEWVFKTPSLRNIEKTAPYFHDGSIESLDEAIRIMALTQLGRELDQQQIDKIAEFFKSLTGTIPEHAL